MLSSATIWMFFLCVWIYLSTTASGGKLVGIRPAKIYTEANRPLEVTCSLNDMADHNLTSEALSFRWKYKNENFNIPNVYVQTPNTTTAVLVLPVVGRDRDRNLLSCYVGDNDDSIYVRVGFKPKPSVNLTVIADNWASMTINWIKEKNPHFRTHAVAYWKIGREEPFKQCLDQESMGFGDIQKYQCWIDISSMPLDSTTYFTIKVSSSNSLGSTNTLEQIFYLHKINKPAKINNLNAHKVDTTWAQLEWTSPSHVSPNRGRSLVYNVTATCLQSTQVFNVAATDEIHLSLNVTGLFPGTQCELSIAARSSHADVWSDPYTLPITTKESVPRALPLTTPGAFDVHTSGDITLYWQPVPVHLQGGQITYYKVIHWFRENGGRTFTYEFPANKSTCRRRIRNEFPNSESYLAVMARTSVGYNESIPLQDQVIVLPQTLIETQKPKNVTAVINANNVTEVRWVGQAKGEYTGYWCAAYGKTCTSTISWIKHISYPWTVPLSSQVDHRRYRFGISLDLDIASSGISWSDCVSQIQAKSSPPTVENKTTTDSITLKLKHAARCSVNAGFIYAYQITYCQSDGNKCVGPTKNLTVSKTGKTTAVEMDGLEENTKYWVSVYSVTAAGLSRSPVTHVLTTMAGVKTEIVSRLAIYLSVGSVFFVFLLIGIYCACTKCRQTCRKGMQKLHIPIKLPHEDTKKELSSDEVPIGYAVPYHNLKPGSASPEGRAQDMIGSYSNVERPPLPPRMQSIPRSDNDSGISFTSEVAPHPPPPASSPAKTGQLPQFVSIGKGGSTEDILDQNQKNVMKDEDYDYNYAPTVSLDETVNGISKPASLSDSPSSSGDESDHYKEAAILLKNVNPDSVSNASKASEEGDLSGSSYGYKPVLLHDLGKSSTPLLSRNTLPTQPVNSQFGGPWEQAQPASEVVVNEPVSVLLDPSILLPMSDGDHIDCYSAGDNTLEDNDSDYGYAPNPVPGLVIGTPDNAWYQV